jgi:AcrR family transcriptional regulator
VDIRTAEQPPEPARPSERARIQRSRILDAAEVCFVQSGFHAASMADIARTAQMSAGLIYRYFDSKGAIVNAIIDRHLYDEAGDILDKLNSPEDMVNAAMAVYERWCQRNDPRCSAAVCLETTAESLRDPQIARASHAADQFVRAGLLHALQRYAAAGGRTLDAATLRSHAMALHCLLDSLLLRAVREPDADRAVLRRALSVAIHALMDG